MEKEKLLDNRHMGYKIMKHHGAEILVELKRRRIDLCAVQETKQKET